MPEYPSNSHKSKLEQQETQALANTAPRKEKVVSGTVRTKKRNELQKIADYFLPEDVQSIKTWFVADVFLPSIKDNIFELVRMFLFGRSGRSNKSSSASKLSYRDGQQYPYNNPVRGNPNANLSSGYDYDDIIFETRGDAEAVLDTMNEIISTYGVVSIADLYDLADVQTSNYTTNRYGWKTLLNCKPVRVRDGYILKLPRAVLID